MGLMFCSLSSGSSGNCYLVSDGDTSILVDAGISGVKTIKGIEDCGFKREDIDALLITHEHIDHIKSVSVLNKRMANMRTYANPSTWEHIYDRVKEERREMFETGNRFGIGGIEVESFPLSHDAADPAGFTFRKDDRQISIITDTGYVTDDAFASIRDADLLVIEANHDPNVLRVCNRPYNVIRRIAGDQGHLSNEAAAECIQKIIDHDPKTRQILLAHLSHDNNHPSLAKATVDNLIDRKEANIRIEVIERNKQSSLYIVE